MSNVLTFRSAPVGVGFVAFGFTPQAMEPTTSHAPTDLAALASGVNVELTWSDTVSDNTGYSIERADLTAGDPFAEIDTAGAGDESYTDVGPFTAKHRYAYRLKVVGGMFDGEYTNQVAIFGGSSHVGRMRRNRYT